VYSGEINGRSQISISEIKRGLSINKSSLRENYLNRYPIPSGILKRRGSIAL
jgi:hypothetical protein